DSGSAVVALTNDRDTDYFGEIPTQRSSDSSTYKSQSFVTKGEQDFIEATDETDNVFLMLNQGLVKERRFSFWGGLDPNHFRGDHTYVPVTYTSSEELQVDCNTLSRMPNVSFTIGGKKFGLTPEQSY
uniref:Aspartic proteinase (Fragments) n=1 Tax=Cynara cardunculus TaxID=4265 RepID=Q7M230_CYNCA